MKGKIWRVLGLTLLGLALSASLVLFALLAWQRLAVSQPGDLAYVPLAADKTLGITSNLSLLGMADQQVALAEMESAGFKWLRQRFPWDAIEAEQGTHDWARWDKLVDGAVEHNLEVVAVLDGSPAWARAERDTGNPLAPPVESRDFGDFVEAFAERYGDRIDYYQIWDEPNIAPHWGAQEIDPAGYARLLREGAIRVRTADPGATVLLAGLAPNVEAGGANMSELLFLKRLYQVEAAQWFDVVAAQPYRFSEPIDARPDGNELNWQRIALLRDVMEAHGDGKTAVWAVSFGVEELMPDAVVEAVEFAREKWPWLGVMMWAAWSPGDAHGQYALMADTARSMAVYEALQEMAASTTVAWPGVYPADHPSGQYKGDWRVTPLGADIGGSGDRLLIPFRGTRLDLAVRRGDYRAFLYVTVDGEAANGLPRDAQGRTYVVLYDPLLQEDRITLARGLCHGEHLAEIVSERGWGQWAIVGWAVAREMPSASPWLPIGLSSAALVTLISTLAWSWPRRNLLIAMISSIVSRYRGLDDRVALVATAGIAILGYAMAGTVATLVALGLLALLLVLRPEMGLPLIALALPFYQLGRPLLGKVFSMVEILTLLTAAGWLVNWGFRRAAHDTKHITGSVRLAPLDWGVLALVAVALLSLLWAEQGRVAAREFRTVILEAAIFYALLRAMLADQRDIWRVADAWVLGGALIGVVGLVQLVFGQNLITTEGVWRVRGFYGSPNNLALYLGKVFPLAVAVAAWGCKGRRRWVYGLVALLMSITILVTYSRGAWIVGVPAALLFLLAMRGRRTFALGLGLLALLTVVFLLVVGTGRLTSLTDTTEGTTFFRLQLWRSSWEMVRDQPLLGVGLDNFLYAYRTRYVLPTAWEEFNLSHPHNVVLDFWLRLGLPGLLVFCWLLGTFFWRGWRLYRTLPESGDRLLVLGLMAGMVNLVAHGLVDNAFFLVDLAFAFMLMIALVQAVRVVPLPAIVANNGCPTSEFIESRRASPCES